MNQINYFNAKDFFALIKENFFRLLFSGFISSLLAVSYSLTLDDIYQSSVTLVPATENTSRSGGSFGGLSAIASFAGVGESGFSQETIIAIEVLKSRDFLQTLFQTHPSILPSIMAFDSYDESTNSIKFIEEKYDASQNAWAINKKPKFKDAYQKFHGSIFKISRDEETQVMKLSVLHESPYFAKQLLEIIVKDLNSFMRIRKLEESIRAKKFLDDEYNSTLSLDIKSSIANLIFQQLQTEMNARIKKDYVFTIIDKPNLAEDKSKPSRTLIVIMGSILGATLVLIFLLIRRLIFQS